MDSHAVVRKKLRELARKRGWSMNLLADFAGMSRSNLSRIMNDKQSPTLRTLTNLADALDVSTVELLSKTDD